MLMNIVLVIYSLHGGGAERQLSEIAAYFAQNGHAVSFVTMQNSSVDFYTLDSSIRLIKLPLPAHKDTIFGQLVLTFRKVRHLRSIFREKTPDVILSFMTATNVMTLLAARGLSTKTIVAERTNPFAANTPYQWKLGRRLLYRHAGQVLAQTHRAAAWLDTHCRCKTAVIPNHLRPLPPLTGASRENTILSVGRLSSEKGFDNLIRAFSMVHEAYPGWQLTILGEGPQRTQLEKLRDELGLNRQIDLPGQVKDVESRLMRAGLVVQASRSEGFPNALLEAMGMGAPVISTDCHSGPAEIISDGMNGRLVPVDDVQALAECMQELLADESMRTRLGLQAVRVRERFSQEKIMDMYRGLFKEIPGQSG